MVMSMGSRIAILHPFLCILGGGEMLAFTAAKILKDYDYDVEIYTLTPVDRSRIEAMCGFSFNIPVKILSYRIEKPINEVLWGSNSKYEKLLMSLELESIVTDTLKDFDLVIDTQSDLILPSDVKYIHFPWLAPIDGDPRYRALYDAARRKLIKLIASSKVLTNSSWTAALIRKFFDVYPDILYPPVKVKEIAEVCKCIEKEPNLVVTISRFAPDKRVDSVVRIAAMVPNMRFVVIGSLSANNRATYEDLLRLKDELRANNIEFLPNLPRDKLIEYLCRATIYLHPMYAEHFGISIVEAMAAGAVPVVYRDGGAWHDVVSRVSSDLGYSTIEEAANVIKTLASSKEQLVNLSKRSRRVARRFDTEVFGKKLIDLVEIILRVRRFSTLS